LNQRGFFSEYEEFVMKEFTELGELGIFEWGNVDEADEAGVVGGSVKV
jgi:hypothetical protein